MLAITKQFEAVREIGEIVLKLIEIGTAPASINCPRDDDGQMILEEDENYWQNLMQVKSLLEEYGTPEVSSPESGYNDDPFSTARVIEVERDISEDSVWRIEILYHAYGEASIFGRLIVDGSEKIVLNPHLNPGEEGAYELSRVDVGRMVAHAELALLAKHLGSSAETLDYWMTNGLSPSLQLTQEDWGSIRGVSRQAVNENVNAARAKLQEN